MGGVCFFPTFLVLMDKKNGEHLRQMISEARQVCRYGASARRPWDPQRSGLSGADSWPPPASGRPCRAPRSWPAHPRTRLTVHIGREQAGERTRKSGAVKATRLPGRTPVEAVSGPALTRHLGMSGSTPLGFPHAVPESTKYLHDAGGAGVSQSPSAALGTPLRHGW